MEKFKVVIVEDVKLELKGTEEIFRHEIPNAEVIGTAMTEEDFMEIYVSTPIEECERRDVKGLYAKARKVEIKNFTGISAPFEAPSKCHKNKIRIPYSCIFR